MLSKFLTILKTEHLALAQEVAAAAPPKGPSMIEVLIMPAGFLVIMYFFMIRPQQKKSKDHADLLANLKSGKVKSVAEGFVSLEVSPNTVIKVIKSNVSASTKQAKDPVK
jgi:preprotein translocase subunit YajC